MLPENKAWAMRQLFAWLKLSDVKGPISHLSCGCLPENQQDLNNFSSTTDLRYKIIPYMTQACGEEKVKGPEKVGLRTEGLQPQIKLNKDS